MHDVHIAMMTDLGSGVPCVISACDELLCVIDSQFEMFGNLVTPVDELPCHRGGLLFASRHH